VSSNLTNPTFSHSVLTVRIWSTITDRAQYLRSRSDFPINGRFIRREIRNREGYNERLLIIIPTNE
jgi:hypothetical protein